MTTIRVSDRLRRLPGYPLADVPAVKRRLVEAGVDVIDLGAGDNDTPPPAEVVAEMVAALADPAMSKYGFQQGLGEFRRAASDYVARRFGARFDPATELIPLIGSKEGLAHLPFAFVDPGNVVILPEPGYQAYPGGALLSGAEPFVYPLVAKDQFLLDLEQVPTPVLDRTRLVYLNYPNNPTAAVAPLDYLERTVATCREHGIALAYDNPYVEITYDGYRAPSIFEIEGAREVAVEFHSVSKSFTLTGWRLGWAVGNPALIAALTKVKSYYDTGPFLAVQHAGVAVLDRAEEVVAPVVARYQGRRDAAVAALRKAGFDVAVPRATLYLWIPLPRGIRSAAFATAAMEEEGVIVLSGRSFGESADGFFRVALTADEARLEEAAVRLGKVLARS